MAIRILRAGVTMSNFPITDFHDSSAFWFAFWRMAGEDSPRDAFCVKVHDISAGQGTVVFNLMHVLFPSKFVCSCLLLDFDFYCSGARVNVSVQRCRLLVWVLVTAWFSVDFFLYIE